MKDLGSMRGAIERAGDMSTLGRPVMPVGVGVGGVVLRRRVVVWKRRLWHCVQGFGVSWRRERRRRREEGFILMGLREIGAVMDNRDLRWMESWENLKSIRFLSTGQYKNHSFADLVHRGDFTTHTTQWYIASTKGNDKGYSKSSILFLPTNHSMMTTILQYGDFNKIGFQWRFKNSLHLI